MKDLPNSITKRMLTNFVHKKISMNVKNQHVVAVISILFDEILKDLKQGKSIKIFNFGKLFLQENKQRKYFDVFKQGVFLSAKRRMLKLELLPRFKKIITKNIDIDKSF